MDIRTAELDDARAIAEIYAPFVLDTPASFEVEAPTAAEMRSRIASTLEHLPWLVCERHGDVAGYAYAAMHRSRIAYQWSVDVSVYIHPSHHRAGIGRALYGVLLECLTRQGYINAYAGITIPNAASVGLHEAMGFRQVGMYEKVGYKLGSWHDVGWWRLLLREALPDPAVPLSFRMLSEYAKR